MSSLDDARWSRLPGEILHLPDAFERTGSRRCVLYSRVSSAPEKYDGTLESNTNSAIEQIELLGGRVSVPFDGQESGKLSHSRRILKAALDWVREYPQILVAWDLSRFIRAEAYDRRSNRDAVPTDTEWRQFFELTAGAMLATIEPPSLTEGERHSRSTKRSGRAGKRVDPANIAIPQQETREGILCDLIAKRRSIRQAAAHYRVSKGSVQRLWDHYRVEKHAVAPPQPYRNDQ